MRRTLPLMRLLSSGPCPTLSLHPCFHLESAAYCHSWPGSDWVGSRRGRSLDGWLTMTRPVLPWVPLYRQASCPFPMDTNEQMRGSTELARLVKVWSKKTDRDMHNHVAFDCIYLVLHRQSFVWVYHHHLAVAKVNRNRGFTGRRRRTILHERQCVSTRQRQHHTHTHAHAHKHTHTHTHTHTHAHKHTHSIPSHLGRGDFPLLCRSCNLRLCVRHATKREHGPGKSDDYCADN